MTSPILPFRLVPDLRPRVWGGTRLAGLVSSSRHETTGASPVATADPGPVGEAWVVWDGCVVADGRWAGRSLADAVGEEPAAVLGTGGVEQAEGRLPLLAKLLETDDWLSLQVHPDDDTAARLEGPGHLGKTEGWYILAASPGAEIILGVPPGMTDAAARSAIGDGTIDDVIARVAVHAGDAVLVQAGVLHSIGPGVLLYEIQQSSDLTYRVSDWGRPPSTGRPLHTVQAIESVRPSITARPRPTALGDDDRITALACEKFSADVVAVRDEVADLDTAGRSFHAVTVLSGGIVAEGEGWSEPLAAFESLLIPAAVGLYRLRPAGGPGRAVVARVP